LTRELKRREEMISINRKIQPIEMIQMNAIDERFNKIEESIVRINESVVKIQQKLETFNIPEVNLSRAQKLEKSQDTVFQLEPSNHVDKNENEEKQNVNY